MGKRFDRYWEMREFTGKGQPAAEIFRCTDCGAETEHPEGFNGEPDPDRCAAHCKSREPGEDWRPGNLSGAYKRNFARIFPASPGAGI